MRTCKKCLLEKKEVEFQFRTNTKVYTCIKCSSKAQRNRRKPLTRYNKEDIRTRDEKQKSYTEVQSIYITDTYVKKCIRSSLRHLGVIIPFKEMPAQLVELRRKRIETCRILKTLRT